MQHNPIQLTSSVYVIMYHNMTEDLCMLHEFETYTAIQKKRKYMTHATCIQKSHNVFGNMEGSDLLPVFPGSRKSLTSFRPRLLLDLCRYSLNL